MRTMAFWGSGLCFSLADEAAGAAAAAAASGAGGAGGDGAGGAGGAGASAAAGAAGASGAAAAAYLPDGFDEKFKGASDRETIDKLWGHYKDAPRPPEKADGYQLALPPELAKVVDVATDKVLPVWRKIAHENGFTQAQFEKPIAQLYEHMIKEGMIEKPLDIQAEFRSLSDGTGDAASQAIAGQRRVLEVRDAIKALHTRGEISEDNVKALGALFDTAAGVKTLSHLLSKIPSAQGLRAGGGQGGAATDPNDMEARALVMFPSHAKRA